MDDSTFNIKEIFFNSPFFTWFWDDFYKRPVKWQTYPGTSVKCFHFYWSALVSLVLAKRTDGRSLQTTSTFTFHLPQNTDKAITTRYSHYTETWKIIYLMK